MTMQWEKVLIFISSPFNDMHAERDYLIKRMFPQLRDWCERRKLRLVDIDLRWGVTEQDALYNKNVVKICFNCIDDCRPFFLCFLGQRRGWVPKYEYDPNKSDKDNEISLSTTLEFPVLLEKRYAGKTSATELEIIHALIDPLHKGKQRDPKKPIEYYDPAKHAFFYLRDGTYLSQLPDKPPRVRQIYTNEGIADETERATHNSELERWRNVLIPEIGQPIHHYQTEWDTHLSTPELLLPLQCPSTEPISIERWRKQWEEAKVKVAGTDIEDDPSQAEEARKFNQSFTKGRLTKFKVGDEDLSQVIIADLQKAITDRFPNHVEIPEETDLQKEMDQQEQFLFVSSEGFIRREGDFDPLDAYVDGDSNQLFALTAPGGMGKSTLLANWIEHYRSRNIGKLDQSIHFRFIGQSEHSTTVYSLLQFLLREMKELSEKFTEAIPDDPQKLRQELPKLLEAVGKRGKTVILLDALNQLESGLSDLTWLPYRLPKNIKLIVSFKRGEENAEELLSHIQGQVIHSEVRPFKSLKHRLRLIRAYLKQYLKDVDKKHWKALIQLPGAENPLYLKVVLSELRVFGAFTNLDAKIRHDFGDSTVSAFNSVLARLESDPAYTSIAPQEAVPLLFGLLAHARHGLSVDELTALFIRARKVGDTKLERDAATDTIHFFLRQVRSFLARRDGRYDFFFESFKAAVLQRYVIEDQSAPLPLRLACDWHRLLADYFASLPTWKTSAAPFRPQPNVRKAAELPFHQTRGELWAEMEQTLCDLVFMDAKCFAGMSHGLIDDYNFALSADGLPQVQEQRIQDYALFLRSQSHILSQVPYLCFQQAANAPKNSELELAANRLISERRSPRSWLRWINKPVFAPTQLATLDGHAGSVNVCVFSGDSTKILSGSTDGTLKLWDVVTGKELCTYTGHPGSVITATISPDGKRVISASVRGRNVIENEAGELHLWDAELGIRLALLLVRRWPVTSSAFSPNGQLMAAGLQDGSVYIWNFETTDPVLTFTGHTREVIGCAFSPDGTELLTVSENDTIRRWDLLTGEFSILDLLMDRKRGYWQRPIAFSNDLTRLITGIGIDGDYSSTKLAIWDVSSGEQLAILSGHQASVHACSFSPDGLWIATCAGERRRTSDNTIKLWKAASGEELVTLTGHNSPVRCCSFSQNGQYLVSGAEDGSLMVWNADIARSRLDVLKRFQKQQDARTQETLHRHASEREFFGDLLEQDEVKGLTKHTAQIWDCAFSPDSTRLVSASKDGSLRIWDVETGYIIAALVGHRMDVRTCAYSTDGRRIISGGYDGKVIIWDAKDGIQLKTLGDFFHNPVFICVVSPDGHLIAAGSLDTTVKLWEAESGLEKATLYGHQAGVTTGTFSPNGRRFASACGLVHGVEEYYDPNIKIWDIETRTEELTLQGGGNVVLDCKFSPDGCYVVAASADWMLRLWNLENPYMPVIMEGHRGKIYACSFSPDGMLIASASEDGTIKFWDTKTGHETATLYNHNGPVMTCAFSPDGNWLGSASEDGTLRLWEVSRRREVCAFWVEKPVGVLTWAPDGRTIAVGDISGDIYLLRLEEWVNVETEDPR